MFRRFKKPEKAPKKPASRPSPAQKSAEPESKKASSHKILTAEGWKRMMLKKLS